MHRARASLAALTLTGLIATSPVAAAGASRSGSAQAATTTVTADDAHGTVTFTAGSGQRNDPSIVHATGSTDTEHLYTFHDPYPITAGPGCVAVEGDPNAATCTLHEGGDYYPFFRLRLGDLADRIDLAGFNADPGSGVQLYIDGGPGDDVLATSIGGGEMLHGGDGNDTLTGASQWGEDGNDTLVGGSGEDGGPGNDRITARPPDPLDPDHGGSRIVAGPGDDRVEGGTGADVIYGNSGNDLVHGGPGNDTIFGGPGSDTLYGNSGDDTITGGPGRDRISGGPGRNHVTQ